jgi:hypothetical protein
MSLERFYLIVGDLRDARKFADYILTRRLHEKRGDTRQLIHRAFNSAMIVSYCRPFMRNLEGPGSEREFGYSPIWHLAKPLLKERFALHRELLRQRNSIYAHSPTGEHFFATPTKGRLALGRDVFAPLNLADTQMLRSIIKSWLAYLEPLQSEFS